jgi:hypothetical protein
VTIADDWRSPHLDIPRSVSIAHSNEGERSRLAGLERERAPQGGVRGPVIGQNLDRARIDCRIVGADRPGKNDERKIAPILDDYGIFECRQVAIARSRRLDLDREASVGKGR